MWQQLVLQDIQKCEDFCEEVDFQRYSVKPIGFVIAYFKVDEAIYWPTATAYSKTLGFLRLENFYRNFIKNFLVVARPLNHLTSENVPFKWMREYQLTFDQLKVAFTSTHILSRPDLTKQFFLKTDAFNYALGGVLL